MSMHTVAKTPGVVALELQKVITKEMRLMSVIKMYRVSVCLFFFFAGEEKSLYATSIVVKIDADIGA